LKLTSASTQPVLPHARTVVCSPHFDDAVLDCWSVLDRDANCAVVNVFTGAPGGGFVSFYDRINGASSSAAHMQERALEDRDALSVAGRKAVDLGLLEAQYRLRQSPLLHAIASRLPPFGSLMLRLPFLGRPLYTTSAPDPVQLAQAIAQAAPDASTVCVPAGIGGHRDHLLVRQAGVVLASRGLSVRMYADLPYAVRHGWPGWIGSSQVERMMDDPSGRWASDLRSVRRYIGDPIREARVVRLTPDERARKETAVRRYATQVDSLNGRRRLLDQASIFSYEVYWEVKSPAGK